MLEMTHIEVFALERALNAKSNSFTVGAIDTTAPFETSADNRQWLVARTLGGNTQAHQSHDAFLKGVLVVFDLKYSQAFTPELQRYHFLEIVMSQSTMHSLKKFMSGSIDPYSKYVTDESKKQVRRLYDEWNERALQLRQAIDREERESALAPLRQAEYEAFMRLRHNLPAGFEMWETISTNYLQLKTICIQRARHRQREDWNAFILGCLSMPHFAELTGLSAQTLGIGR